MEDQWGCNNTAINNINLPLIAGWEITLTTKLSKGKYPLRNGQQTRCNIWESINHWVSQCPNRSSENVTYMVHKIVQQNSSGVALQTLLWETWCCAVIDSGSSSTVCGWTWFQWIPWQSLSKWNNRSDIFNQQQFRLGDGGEVKYSRAATVSVNFGPYKVAIKIDIVDANIALLLQLSSMEKAQMRLNFNSNTIIFNDFEMPFKTTFNGLHVFPIRAPKVLIKKFDNNKNEHQIGLPLLNANQTRR